MKQFSQLSVYYVQDPLMNNLAPLLALGFTGAVQSGEEIPQ